jgi:hypothetical protein
MFNLTKGFTLLAITSIFVLANNEIAEAVQTTHEAEDQAKSSGDKAIAEQNKAKNKNAEDEKAAQSELDKQRDENKKKNNAGKTNKSLAENLS